MTVTEALASIAGMLECGVELGELLSAVEAYGDLRADEVLSEVAR
jgi:hypothetical protein